MSKSGVTVSPECISTFNDLKLGKSIKYIIYKLSDDYKEIVVEETSTDAEWENFQNKIMNAKASYKGKEGKGPRYAVYDFQYELEGGEGTRSFVADSWVNEQPRMTYASSKEALKNALNGLGAEVQANNEDEIEYSTILKDISRGKR
ncbi:MAG: hypothetical protein LQ343_004424 [Gyalolechia ehrenbergii]|nr:MAG: hypothetical protein LQ343_004424 [Gyalolechia ehrenbergii]